MQLNPPAQLMRPKGSTSVLPNSPTESWFSIRGALNGEPVEILIYDEIGGWGISARQFANELREKDVFSGVDVDLHIHSGGGSVLDAFAIFNMLKGITGKLNIFIDGLAASMASVIACLPNGTVHIPENGWFYLHNAWGGQVGEAEDMIEYAEFLERNVKNMVKAYIDKTGQTDEAIRALMKKPGTWLDGAQAIELGFADVLTEPLQAAASINLNRQKELLNMPGKLQGLLAPKGNKPPTATPAPTQPPAGAQPPAVPTPAPSAQQQSPGDIMAQFRQQEAERRTGIQGVFGFAPGRFPEVEAACIADMNCTVDQAKDKLLEAMGKGITPTGATYVHAGNGNIVGDSVRASVMARAGFEAPQADNAYNHMTLRELARASLVDRGVGVAAYNPMQMVGLSFTHTQSDFGNILLDVANKALLSGWETSEETFEKWTKKGELSDFKTARRVGVGAFPTLRQVRAGAEYKYVKLSDHGESIALATYGELFSLDRQTIINDDLQALLDMARKMGMAAKATIGDLVYAVLTSNPKMNDGKALFHADHGNLGAGAISVESLDANRQLMRKQKDNGRHLNIRPAYALMPTCLESKANQVIRSSSVAGTDTNAGVINPIQNFAEVIAEPRLDDDSTKAWYLAAKGDTIEVAYLNGIDTPYIEQQSGFTTDGVATKVRIDAGVSPNDYRGLVKSTGA